MSEEQGTGKKPSHTAYQVNQSREGQSYFNRVGSAFEHKDGKGYDVVLQSMPVNGRVTLRNTQEKLEGLKQGQQHDQERDL